MIENRIRHLEFIQSAIGRMAQNSFTIKGWAITLVSAILVLAHDLSGWQYLLISLLPTVTFWGFDSYYLRQERLFRHLYNSVRLMSDSEWANEQFNLNLDKSQYQVSSWCRICFSRSVVWLYLPMLLLVITATLISARDNIQSNEDKINEKSVLQLPLRERQLENSPDSQCLGD